MSETVSETQSELKIVGVNFKPNPSLSTRYESYLTSTSLTSPSTFLQRTESSVMVATAGAGTADPLVTLNKLANRWDWSVVNDASDQAFLCLPSLIRPYLNLKASKLINF